MPRRKKTSTVKVDLEKLETKRRRCADKADETFSFESVLDTCRRRNFDTDNVFGLVVQIDSAKYPMYEFVDHCDTFMYNKIPITGGSYGAICRGAFNIPQESVRSIYLDKLKDTKASNVVIKINLPSADKKEVLCELKLQIMLFCDQRKSSPPPGSARIPKPIFAAVCNTNSPFLFVSHKKKDKSRILKGTHIIGMEPLEQDITTAIIKYKKDEAALWKEFHSALRQVALCLKHLQSSYKFMHGDLHAGNVMEKAGKYYIIDFGMSSYDDEGKRIRCNKLYRGKPFNQSLDLLMLVMTLYNQFKYHDTRVNSFCRCIISGFMHKIAQGALPGFDKMHKAYVSSLKSGSPLFHCFYDNVGAIENKATTPDVLLKVLDEYNKADVVTARTLPFAGRIAKAHALW